MGTDKNIKLHIVTDIKGNIDMAEVAEADRLYAENKRKELHEYLLQFTTSDNHELLWRSVRAHRDRSVMADVNEEEKKKLIFDGMEVAKRALEFGDNDYACHKWYGVMLSRTGDYLGTKIKINNAFVIKEHFQKAIELCPSDATSHYLIGMWCFNCANLAWYERKMATLVFGTPPSATYEEALTHFVKAEEMNPLFYSDNLNMIGLMNLKIGKKAEAKVAFSKLSNYDAKTDEDREKVKKAVEQLKSL